MVVAVAAVAVEAVVVLCTGWLALPENASSYGFQDLLDLCVALFSLNKHSQSITLLSLVKVIMVDF